MSAPLQRQDRIARLEADIKKREEDQTKMEFFLEKLQSGLDMLGAVYQNYDRHDEECHDQALDFHALNGKAYSIDLEMRDEHYDQLYKLVQQVHDCLKRYDAAGLRRTAASIGELVMKLKDARQETLLTMMSLDAAYAWEFS